MEFLVWTAGDQIPQIPVFSSEQLAIKTYSMLEHCNQHWCSCPRIDWETSCDIRWSLGGRDRFWLNRWISQARWFWNCLAPPSYWTCSGNLFSRQASSSLLLAAWAYNHQFRFLLKEGFPSFEPWGFRILKSCDCYQPALLFGRLATICSCSYL